MYNIVWLSQVARQGLSDLVPAMRQAFNDDPTDDRLELVYGQMPRRNILVIALAGIVAGSLFALVAPDFPFKDEINWPAVWVGAIYAALFRRYLFGKSKAAVADFPWLAASLAPAVLLLMVVSAVSSLASASDDSSTSVFGDILVAATDALGVAAALTIAVAALCYSRNWARALWDLGVRLLVFRIMVWITALIMLEIGIIGPIVSAMLQSIFGLEIPEWIPELFDQLTYAALLGVAYLAVIGATWTVCRESFDKLLETGQVNILTTVAAMAADPENARRKKEKKAQRKMKRKQSLAGNNDPKS